MAVTRRPRRRAAVAVPLRLLALAGVLAFATACGESSDPVPPCGRLGDNPGRELTIGEGLTPTLRWTPDCLATSLEVYHNATTAPGEVVWRVEAPAGQAGFASGVVYGTAPRGADVDVAPVPLVAGERYIASIYIHGAVVEATPFTP